MLFTRSILTHFLWLSTTECNRIRPSETLPTLFHMNIQSCSKILSKDLQNKITILLLTNHGPYVSMDSYCNGDQKMNDELIDIRAACLESFFFYWKNPQWTSFAADQHDLTQIMLCTLHLHKN